MTDNVRTFGPEYLQTHRGLLTRRQISRNIQTQQRKHGRGFETGATPLPYLHVYSKEEIRESIDLEVVVDVSDEL